MMTLTMIAKKNLLYAYISFDFLAEIRFALGTALISSEIQQERFNEGGVEGEMLKERCGRKEQGN